MKNIFHLMHDLIAQYNHCRRNVRLLRHWMLLLPSLQWAYHVFGFQWPSWGSAAQTAPFCHSFFLSTRQVLGRGELCPELRSSRWIHREVSLAQRIKLSAGTLTTTLWNRHLVWSMFTRKSWIFSILLVFYNYLSFEMSKLKYVTYNK